jgi:hypothetical protein
MGVSGQHHAPAALCPRGKDSRYPLYRRLGGPQSRSGHRGYGKNLLPLLGIEPGSPSRPVRSQPLYWLSYPGSSPPTSNWNNKSRKHCCEKRFDPKTASVTYILETEKLFPFDGVCSTTVILISGCLRLLHSQWMTRSLILKNAESRTQWKRYPTWGRHKHDLPKPERKKCIRNFLHVWSSCMNGQSAVLIRYVICSSVG